MVPVSGAWNIGSIANVHLLFGSSVPPGRREEENPKMVAETTSSSSAEVIR
jgi:hypothetical protein